MTATSIPDDCDLLIIDGATSDFTKDEVKLLSSYLKKGGKVVTLLAQTNKSMKNLYGLLKDYGLTVQSGYIADTERSYQGNYYYLIPNLSVSGDMASGISSNSVTACLNNADNVSISPKSLEVSYNTIAHPGPFSILVVFVIPVGLIIGGFIVWFRRRRR